MMYVFYVISSAVTLPPLPLVAVLEMDCEALCPGKCSLQPIKVKDHTTARVLCSCSFSMFNMFTVPFPSMSTFSETHVVSDTAALSLGLQTGSVPCRQLMCEGMVDSLLCKPCMS